MALKDRNLWTTEGAGVFINFDGHNKDAKDILMEIMDVVSVSAIEKTREAKKKGTVKGEEYAVAGKLTNSDMEIKFLLRESNKGVYENLHIAINDVAESEVMLKVQYPWGETFYGNYIAIGLTQPEANENSEIVEITAKFTPSGNLKRVASA